MKHLIGPLLLACALALVVSTPSAPAAASASPCWKALLNDWYDGTINKLYNVACYRQAIAHLPTDVAVYSSARDDIDRALQVAIAHKKNPSTPVTPVTDAQPTPATTTTPAGGTTTASPGRTTSSGPIPSAIDSSSPGGATSFPLPLVILGGLALFLLAAGIVGLVVRRMQGRGEPPATP